MPKSAASTQGRTRRLRDGSSVPERDAPVNLTITTSCPAKWAFVDLETGSIWVDPDSTGYREASSEVRRTVAAAATGRR